MKHILLFILFVAFISVPLASQAEGLGDMTMDSKIESMKKAGKGPVIFPHTRHEEVLKCADCHPKIFKEERGANDLSMMVNMEGGACGSLKCHDSVNAFALYVCDKCHTKP